MPQAARRKARRSLLVVLAIGISFVETLVVVPAVSSFSLGRWSVAPITAPRRQPVSRRSSRLSETIERDGLFWPSSFPKRGSSDKKSVGRHDSADDDDTHDGDDRDWEDDEEEEGRLAAERTLDSVLKVYATHSEPDYLIPWQKQHQTTSTSSGFVLNVPGIGLRVMTNAHSVEYGSVVQVQKRGDAEKHAAIVEAVGNECDLTLLRVDSLFPPGAEVEGASGCADGGEDDDESSLFPLPLGPLPSLQDEVEVLGYPAGGDSLSVTKGVVSRIEMQEYAQAGAHLLAVQIDAAINPGNSGGPVVNEYFELVGVAFQGIDDGSIENVGYVVPASVVRHFLEDVRRNLGRYTGFCSLGINVMFLENATFRRYLGLEGDRGVDGDRDGDGETARISGTENRRGESGAGTRRRSTGIVARRVDPISGAFGIVRPQDVILSVDGIPIGNDGKIPFRRGERVDLGCYVSSLFEGDDVRLTIWREGKEIDVYVPVTPNRFLEKIRTHFDNRPPPFLVCAGFVFTVLSVPYLDAKGAWDDYYTPNVSYLLGLVNEPPDAKGDEVVVLAQVLAHRANLGYEHFVDLHLLKFNSEKVRSLHHLLKLINKSTGPYITLEFAPEEGGRLVVLDRESCEEVTTEICEEHSIGKSFVLHDAKNQDGLKE